MTAHATLRNFLRNWKNGNTKRMFFYCTKTWKSEYEVNEFEGKELESFEIVGLGKESMNYVHDFHVKLNGELHTCRLVKEEKPHCGSLQGVWGVYPISFRPA